MKIALVNCDIEWESPAINLANFDKILSNFINEGVNKPDLIVFPELFTTGFSVSDRYAESLNGDTHKWMKGWSIRLDSAIMASIPVQEGDNLYNRALFVTPKDDFHYDKRHLFSLGGEQSLFKKGRTPVIINFRGFNIFLQICYDLRFPVWSRNAGLLYDLTINIANWPASRDSVIESMCRSRAIENLSYFAFVNRKGFDPQNDYTGQKFIVDFKGNYLTPLIEHPDYETFEIDKAKLVSFRDKFPVWRDADTYSIEY